MKRFLLAATALCAASSAHAQATRAQVSTQNDTTFYKCGVNCITPANVHAFNAAVITGAGFLADANTWSGANIFTASPIFYTPPVFSGGTGFVYANGSSPSTILTPTFDTDGGMDVHVTNTDLTEIKNNTANALAAQAGPGVLIGDTDMMINGAQVDTGAGTGGTHTQRVMLDSAQSFADPCAYQLKSFSDFSGTATGTVVAGAAGQKTYICSIYISVATAENVSLIHGTGSACAGGTPARVALNTGTTAANGAYILAGTPIAIGNGSSMVAVSNTTGDNVCLLLSGSGQANAHIGWVQQ